MKNIKLYTASDKYIDYLSIYEPHLFHNKKRLFCEKVTRLNGVPGSFPVVR